MQRRTLLKSAVGAGLATTLSGCLGYTVESTDTVNSRQEKISNQSSKIEELDKQVDNLKAQLEESNEENAELETELDQKSQDLEDAKEKQILYLYGYGITTYNKGIDYYNSAYNRVSNRDYDGARADFNVAGGFFESADVYFGGAAERATELGKPTVQTYASDAKTKCSHLISALSNYQQSMYYYEQGQNSKAREYLDKGDTQYQTAQNYELRDRSTLEEKMGVSLGESSSSATTQA